MRAVMGSLRGRCAGSGPRHRMLFRRANASDLQPASMSASSRRKSATWRWGMRGLLLFCSVVFALLVAEVVFRIAGLFQTHPRPGVGEHENVVSRNFAPDSRLGWKMPADTRF